MLQLAEVNLVLLTSRSCSCHDETSSYRLSQLAEKRYTRLRTASKMPNQQIHALVELVNHVTRLSYWLSLFAGDSLTILPSVLIGCHCLPVSRRCDTSHGGFHLVIA